MAAGDSGVRSRVMSNLGQGGEVKTCLLCVCLCPDGCRRVDAQGGGAGTHISDVVGCAGCGPDRRGGEARVYKDNLLFLFF